VPAADALVVVSTTVASAGDADRLATLLVEERLAACVQVTGPLRSTYRWRAVVEQTDEWALAIKTTAAALPALEARLAAEHPYELPEIVAVEVRHASAGYAAWVREAVAP